MAWTTETMGSPIGPLHLVASPNGVRGLFFRPIAEPPAGGAAEDGPARRHLATLKQQLDEYFRGERRAFDVAIDLTEGTAFQRAVWAELARIPYGATISYRELARRVGAPKAVRAVGSANGRNPVSILVPCHRVIAADGTLGGYGGGLATKRFLLDLESSPRFPKGSTAPFGMRPKGSTVPLGMR